jgi:Flp pilus assembly secretin CpaC
VPARGGAAKDLAALLNGLFQGQGPFEAVADAGGQSLVLSGAKNVLDEATALVQQIDRPVPSVKVEVTLLDLAVRSDGKGAGGDAKPADRPELAGAAGELATKIDDLKKRGVVVGVKRLQLTALDRQQARAQSGGSKPMVVGTTMMAGQRRGFGGDGAGGGAAPAPVTSRSINYREVGTMVQVKPEVAADGTVTLDLRIEDSRMNTPEGGIPVGSDERGAPIPAAEYGTIHVETRLRIRSGQAVVAQSLRNDTKGVQTETVVLVSVRTEDSRPAERKP